ncbi:MAG: 5-formyltetrahydrofolate cyclo-ligase [Clostridia bacterium]|nr:5-formyltetrahydrofolate cyclo-ligase [Clostridia bacterium]
MKKELRKQFVKARKESYDMAKCLAVCENVLALDEYQNAKDILCYASYNFEVDTFYLMKKILLDGKNLYLPRCITDTREMEVCRVKDLSELKSGAYGIKEPTGERVSKEILDMIIVPMVAFDRQKTRLGYGGGYYDRFLPETMAAKVGIAFSVQESECLIKESTDVPMDTIVTEKEVIV